MKSAMLLKLAEILEECSKGRTLHIPDDGKVGFDMGTVVEVDHACGSTCCAMGFAGLHPYFRKKGLHWDFLAGTMMLDGKKTFYDDAAKKLFGLTDDQVYHLFCNNSPTPKAEAKLIRKFVASGGKVPEDEDEMVFLE